MELERHVLASIDDFDQRKLDSALMHASTAIEGTARNLFSVASAGKKEYKNCIRQYYWLIEAMIGAGLNLEETKWNNLNIDNGRGQIIENPDLADIIYHIFRCNHAHSKAVPLNFSLRPVSDGYSTWLIGPDMVQMPERVIWALLAISVFSRANGHIKTAGDYHLSWGSEQLGIGPYKFPIKDNWGKEAEVKAIFQKHKLIRVKIEGLGRQS